MEAENLGGGSPKQTPKSSELQAFGFFWNSLMEAISQAQDSTGATVEPFPPSTVLASIDEGRGVEEPRRRSRRRQNQRRNCRRRGDYPVEEFSNQRNHRGLDQICVVRRGLAFRFCDIGFKPNREEDFKSRNCLQRNFAKRIWEISSHHSGEKSGVETAEEEDRKSRNKIGT
ncbi:hypothetical protein U1Q18_024235 [Sarracenia purpurea var. burkii]